MDVYLVTLPSYISIILPRVWKFIIERLDLLHIILVVDSRLCQLALLMCTVLRVGPNVLTCLVHTSANRAMVIPF